MAMPKYIEIVIMSLIIVAIGPADVAGSMPNFLKRTEIIVEKNA